MHAVAILFPNKVDINFILFIGNLELSDYKVLLNNENKYTGCFVVAFPDDNTECDGNRARLFTIQLAWIRPNNPDYTIYMAIDRKNVSVTIADNRKKVLPFLCMRAYAMTCMFSPYYVAQDCPITTETSSKTAAIVVPIVVILFLVLGIAIALLVVFTAWRRNPQLFIKLKNSRSSSIEKVSSSSDSQNGETELKKPEVDAEKSSKEGTPKEDSSEESDKGETKEDDTPKSDGSGILL